MKDNFFDIIIIGGGLAGLTLSIQAANKGYSVALFEKDGYPFHKVCGEYISMESYDFLKRCGVDLDNWDLPTINRLQITDCSGKQYEFDLPLGGFGVSRYKLDYSLVEIAKEKGVLIYDRTKVEDVSYADEIFTVSTTTKNVTSSIVAGTFGKRSNLDIKWGRPFSQKTKSKLNNYVAVKYHIIHDHDPNVIALHNFKNGYCGMSQIEDGKSCLCYLTSAKNLMVSNYSIDQMEKKILSDNSALAEIFDKASFVFQKPVTISQVSFHSKCQVDNHILIIGDAAGLITPLCGNGMSMAMYASFLAFKEIHAFLQKEITRSEMEERYQSVWKKSFYTRLLLGRIIQRYFGHPIITRFFLKTMSQLPWFANWLIKKTHGSSF